MDHGVTTIGPRATAAAVRHALGSIAAVESCTVNMETPFRAVVELWVTRDAVEADVRSAVEHELGMAFWIDIGMADGTYSVTAVHRPA